MIHGLLFVCAIAVCFVGCAIIFIDVLFTRQTDYCQEKIPAECITGADGDCAKESDRLRFFVLAFPEFSYTFEGKRYAGKSMNVFFHILLLPGKMAVPFIAGKTYYIYVNPANPSKFVSDGEQRITFLHILGCSIAVLGALFLMSVY